MCVPIPNPVQFSICEHGITVAVKERLAIHKKLATRTDNRRPVLVEAFVQLRTEF
jgi:hypothetical protein